MQHYSLSWQGTDFTPARKTFTWTLFTHFRTFLHIFNLLMSKDSVSSVCRIWQKYIFLMSLRKTLLAHFLCLGIYKSHSKYLVWNQIWAANQQLYKVWCVYCTRRAVFIIQVCHVYFTSSAVCIVKGVRCVLYRVWRLS